MSAPAEPGQRPVRTLLLWFKLSVYSASCALSSYADFRAFFSPDVILLYVY